MTQRAFAHWTTFAVWHVPGETGWSRHPAVRPMAYEVDRYSKYRT